MAEKQTNLTQRVSRSFRESELQELEPRERPGYKPRPGYLRDKRTENVVKDLNLTLDTGQFRLIFRRGNLSLRFKRILIASSATCGSRARFPRLLTF